MNRDINATFLQRERDYYSKNISTLYIYMLFKIKSNIFFNTTYIRHLYNLRLKPFLRNSITIEICVCRFKIPNGYYLVVKEVSNLDIKDFLCTKMYRFYSRPQFNVSLFTIL